MLDKIIDSLRKIEKQEDIIIIYACESGSRAWGFDSRDSDYDVRFFYVRPQEIYNTIYPSNYANYTLDRNHSQFIKSIVTDDLDFVGHDVKKALYMVSKGNPDIISWLYSPIQYLETHISIMIRLHAERFFNTKAGIYHYQHMAAGNFNQYIKNREDQPVKIKKYLYVLRPLICCYYIETFLKAPPMRFDECLKYTYNRITEIGFNNVIEEIKNLINKKKNGEELGQGDRNKIIDMFCEFSISYFSKIDIEIKKIGEWTELDKLFNYIIQTQGGKHGTYLLPCETR